MYRLSLIIFFLIVSFNSFSQTNTYGTTESYKIITIDSTENNYIIFVSTNLCDTLSNVNIPFLSKEDECNHYLICHYNNPNQYCLVSPKINGLNENICIGKNYNLSLNCITYKTLNTGYVHIGYGDYILQNPTDKLCTAKEIVGLWYGQNVDTLKYYDSLLYQKKIFDSKMFYIWINLNKQSGICYSQWLNEKKYIQKICLNFNNDTIVLYQDENCKIPYMTIKREDYYKNGALKTYLIYKYKNKCFIQIDNEIDTIYGWIKKCGNIGTKWVMSTTLRLSYD